MEPQITAKELEAEPLLPKSSNEAFKVYPGRFYVLAVLALLAIQQNVAWMTFGTIPDESYEHFGLSDNVITLLAAYGSIVFILLIFPSMWFLDRYGLKLTVVPSAWVLAIGSTIRCFVPDGHSWWIILFHIGHIMIAFVGIAIQMTPPRLSSVWFPPKQRAFATAVTTLAESMGITIAFLALPYITKKYSIHTMLYIQAEMSICVAALATIYFPPKPSTPPSPTADQERVPFLKSMKLLLTNVPFLFLAISGGISTGSNMGFSSVLPIILNPTSGFTNNVGISSWSQFFHSNAWLGAISAFVGVIGGQLAGIIADRFQRKLKLLLIILLGISTAFGLYFSLAVYGYISGSAVNIFMGLCLQYFFTFATTPLYYEAAVEVTYPVPEGSSAGILATLSNIGALMFQVVAFMHIFSNAHPEKARAMVWAFSSLGALSWLFLAFYREQYKRLDLDDEKEKQVDQWKEVNQ